VTALYRRRGGGLVLVRDAPAAEPPPVTASGASCSIAGSRFSSRPGESSSLRSTAPGASAWRWPRARVQCRCLMPTSSRLRTSQGTLTSPGRTSGREGRRQQPRGPLRDCGELRAGVTQPGGSYGSGEATFRPVRLDPPHRALRPGTSEVSPCEPSPRDGRRIPQGGAGGKKFRPRRVRWSQMWSLVGLRLSFEDPSSGLDAGRRGEI